MRFTGEKLDVDATKNKPFQGISTTSGEVLTPRRQGPLAGANKADSIQVRCRQGPGQPPALRMYRPVGAVPVQNQTPVADRPAFPGMHTGNRVEVLAQRRRAGINGAYRPGAGGRPAGTGMVPAQNRQIVVATLADRPAVVAEARAGGVERG